MLYFSVRISYWMFIRILLVNFWNKYYLYHLY